MLKFTDNTLMNTQKTNTFTKTHKESLSNKAAYEQFINWVSGDFELFLQDYDDGLTIYFPGGRLKINETSVPSAHELNFEINITSKFQKELDDINKRILLLLAHYRLFYN